MSRFNDSTEFTLQFSSLFFCRQKKCKRVAPSVLPSRFPLKIGFHFLFWDLKGAMSGLDFLKVVRLVFWSGVVGRAFARSRFALTVALRAQKLDLWASLCQAMLAVLCHAICHIFKKLKLFSHWIPNLMVQFHYLRLFLGIRWNHCLPSVSTNGNDGHGLNLEKAGPSFSRFNAMPAKITKKSNKYG